MIFNVNDCSLITRMAGIREALNLRELEERITHCPDGCLFHHFCETVIRPTFDDPDYPNDFALWASRELGDRILAERLAVINPYKLSSLGELRQELLDVIQERLTEVEHIPWARDHGFEFMQAVTVVFNTGIVLETLDDFIDQLPNMSLGSVYYHFVEARRRTETKQDDFTNWMKDFGEEAEPLIKSLAEIDFYYLSLRELREILIEKVNTFRGVKTT